MARSIAFLKFKSTLEIEIRSFWHLLSALDISDREVDKYTSNLITGESGNNRYPFIAISITPSDYIKESTVVSGHVRENSLVSFITTFESYLFELTERIIYLNPESISDSDMNMTAGDIISVVNSNDPKKWISHKVAEKYLRNKTHTAMIKKIDKLSKAGTSTARVTDIEEWNKWTLLRNSIVHTTRQVTQELSDNWPDKFPTPGNTFSLTNQDVSRVFSLAISLAESIDKMAVTQVIKKSDALALAREIYIHHGISKSGELKKMISHSGMRLKLTNEDLERTLARHRRGESTDSLKLSYTEINRLLA